MSDGIILRGRLQVFATPSDSVLSGAEFRKEWCRGRITTLLDQHNLIVDTGLQAIAKFLGNNANAPLVGGGSFSDLSDITIGSMVIGSTVGPPAPNVADTNSVGTLVYTPVISVSYPTNFSVQFTGVIPITELIGTILTEEALKLVNGKTFAKVSLATPVTKSGSHALQFSHTVLFARA